MTVINNTYQKICALAFVSLVGFWIVIQIRGTTDNLGNFVYSWLFGLVPFIGGFIGMVKSGIWGRFKSALGKAIFFFSLGLFCWGVGENIWSYYNIVQHISAPYPSLADIGFATSIVFWAIGAVYLSKASGARFAFGRSKWAKLFTIITPIVILAGSYYLLVTVARQGVLVPPGETTLKVVLDIAYPFGDLISLVLATVILGLSFKYFGGIYRVAIISILIGLGVMYFGDMIFSYTTTVGTYFNADKGDLILSLGVTLMTFGILGFASKPPPAVKPKPDHGA